MAVDKLNKFIYITPLDAVLYLILFVMSFIVPVLVQLENGDQSFYFSLFINSAIIVREYILLWQNETISHSYWIKRLIGSVASFTVFLYSLVILFLRNSSTMDLNSGILTILNILMMIVVCTPMCIAAMEVVAYVKNDYNKRFGKSDSNPQIANNITKKV